MPSTYDKESLYLLADKLLPDDYSLQEEIKLAVEQPNFYAKKFTPRLENRGMSLADTNTKQKLPWYALIDGLEGRGYLRELDWKETPDDTVRWIDDLTQKRLGLVQPDRWNWAEGQDFNSGYTSLYAVAEKFPEWEWLNQIDWWHWESSTENFLSQIGSHLEERNLYLAYLNIDSDSFPLVVVKTEDMWDLWDFSLTSNYGHIVLFQYCAYCDNYTTEEL